MEDLRIDIQCFDDKETAFNYLNLYVWKGVNLMNLENIREYVNDKMPSGKGDDFSTFDIQKGLELPQERLRQWLKNEYIVPAVPAKGQGTRASFTKTDCYRVELFRRLVDSGLKREIAAKFLGTLTDDDLKNKATAVYNISGFF